MPSVNQAQATVAIDPTQDTLMAGNVLRGAAQGAALGAIGGAISGVMRVKGRRLEPLSVALPTLFFNQLNAKRLSIYEGMIQDNGKS
jgi:hypothetical protein